VEKGESQVEGSSSLMHQRSSKNEESKNDNYINKGVRSPRNIVDDVYLIDYFFSIDSGHKDFVRSMIQTNGVLITGSEDKSLKIFTLT